jgi:hypothetical protein
VDGPYSSFLCAPWKGVDPQRVQLPPGNSGRSSR